MTADGVRARVRAQMTDEIKAAARRHLATDGADLSLRAVARDLGMASSAVYRYFASRDELLTALIIDAYDAVGAEAEQAAAAVVAPPARRFLAVCFSVREWALANPHEWALIYGSPVPGYQAPADTIAPASRVILQIAALVRDADREGLVQHGPAITGRFAEELAVVGDTFAGGVPPQVVGAAMSAFIHLCGAVSAELFGQLANTVDDDRAGFFEFQMRGAAAFIGLTA